MHINNNKSEYNHCDFMSHADIFTIKTQLLVHHTSDIHIFQPKLSILFLTLGHI